MSTQSIAGTFTFTAHWNGGVGISDPLPYNCTAAQAVAARTQAFERAANHPCTDCPGRQSRMCCGATQTAHHYRPTLSDT